jgi:hypothetical protein
MGTEGGQILPLPIHQTTRAEYSAHGFESGVINTKKPVIYKLTG